MNPLLGVSQFQTASTSLTPMNVGAGTPGAMSTPGMAAFGGSGIQVPGAGGTAQNFGAMPGGQSAQQDPIMMMGMMIGMMGMMLMSMMMMLTTMLQKQGPMGGAAATNPALATGAGTATGGSPSGTSSSPAGSKNTSAGTPSSGGSQGGNLKGITRNQFSDLNDPDKGSMCGIVAAEAFSKAAGTPVDINKIKQTAVANGYWDAGSGMHGAASEVSILNKIGVKAHLEQSIDWEKIKKTVQSGKPVIIDTPGHYLVVEGYDPATGKFDLGNSAGILKSAGGKTQFTQQELMAGGLGKSKYIPRSAIFLD